MNKFFLLLLLGAPTFASAQEVGSTGSCVFQPAYKSLDFYVHQIKPKIRQGISDLPCIVDKIELIGTYSGKNVYLASYIRGSRTEGNKEFYDPGIKHRDIYLWAY